MLLYIDYHCILINYTIFLLPLYYLQKIMDITPFHMCSVASIVSDSATP